MSIEVISWNVNGIRAVVNKKGFEWVDERSPDILCLQEIKAMEDQIPDGLFENDFLSRAINPAERKGYSGTATFSQLSPQQTETRPEIDIENEGRIIEQDFGDFVLFNVYFPNGQKDEERLQYKLKFYDDFLAHCNALREQGKSIVIGGDVNTAHKPIDLKNPKSNEKTSGFLEIERAWIDKLIENGYVDTYLKRQPNPHRAVVGAFDLLEDEGVFEVLGEVIGDEEVVDPPPGVVHPIILDI